MVKVREINACGGARLCLEGVAELGMLFVFSGSGELRIGDKVLPVSRGRVVFLTAGDVVVLERDPVLSGFLVSYERVFWEGLLWGNPHFRRSGMFNGLLSVDVAAGEVLVLLEELRWLKAEMESGFDVTRLKLRFNLVMTVVLGGLEMGEVGKLAQLRTEFLEVLEGNFRLQRKSGFYAERLGVTSRKLNGLCRGWFEGNDFVRVHRERLMREAEFLLLETDRPIKEIAFDLGFCSQQHFRGYFVKVKRLCPTSFRVTIKKKSK